MPDMALNTYYIDIYHANCKRTSGETLSLIKFLNFIIQKSDMKWIQNKFHLKIYLNK